MDEEEKSLTLAATGNVITFIYTPNTDIKYTVEYETADGTKLLNDKLVLNQTMASTVTETAEEIAGYTVDEETKSLTLAATGNVITFVYTPNEDTPYRVEFYYANYIGAYPDEPTSVDATRVGTTDTTVSVTEDDKVPLPGYKYVVTDDTKESGQVAGNGSLVLKLYFARDEYAYKVVEHYEDANGNEKTEETTGKAAFEEAILELSGVEVLQNKEYDGHNYTLTKVDGYDKLVSADVTKNEVHIYYALDEAGEGDDPTKPDDVPDKYQTTVVFAAVNGTVDGATQVEKVVTLTDEEGNWSETGSYTLTDEDIPEAIAATGYAQSTKEWDVNPVGAVIDADENTKASFVVSFSPADQEYIVQYIDEDTNEGLKEQDTFGAKFGDYINGADHAIAFEGYAFTHATELWVTEDNQTNYVFVYYSKDEKGEDGPDDIPDKYQLVFTYQSADPNTGEVTGKTVEVYNFIDTPIEPTYPAANVTAAPAANYAFDYWVVEGKEDDPDYTRDMTFLKQTAYDTDTTFVAYFDTDEIGKEDPEKPDGVPDKYQIKFTYETEDSTHGTIDGASAAVEVVDRPRNSDGSYDMEKGVSPSVNVTVDALGRYRFENWTDEAGNTYSTSQLQAATFTADATFTAHFRYVSGNGNGNGGGSSSGSGGNPYNPDAPGPGTVMIDDDNVPLAPLPQQEGESFVIDEDSVPLAPLPKTGQQSSRIPVTMLLTGIFLALASLTRRREEES